MPKTVIFANGISADPNKNRRLIEPDDIIICADGGTLHALALGLTPNLIVGDLDSLPDDIHAEMIARGVEIQQHPTNKDQTDLALALQTAIERGATEILLLAALGGRLDQYLANILLLTCPEWAGVRLRLADGNQQAWLMRGPDRLQLQGHIGDTFSVLPFSPTIGGLTLAGAAWPLERADVGLGSTLTISNCFAAPEIEISLETGIALLVHINGGHKQ